MKISLLQWNFLYKENPDNIIKVIKKLNPDIICAQELIQNLQNKIIPNEPDYIAKKINYHYFYHQADTWSPPRNGKETQGNAIFSRFPMISKSHYYLSPPHHNSTSALDEGRVYLESVINTGNFTITIATTHLSFSPKFRLNKKRLNELKILTKIIKSKKNNYILTGDLNTIPSSLIIKTILRYLKNAGPDLSEPTWTTKAFNYHQLFIETKLRWRLDYIFTSQNIKICYSKIIKTKVSDHLPILSLVEL